MSSFNSKPASRKISSEDHDSKDSLNDRASNFLNDRAFAEQL